jgi:dihydrodiol dehydrogenase / D-xylose 1-dehydrogenase (NADP)
MGAPSDAKAYGSYEELAKDPNVEIIYVATPHSHHYQNVRLCLEHGKHVLCEKAFTVNASQLKKLVEIAREKKLFLMEVRVILHYSMTWANPTPSGCLDSLLPSLHLRS